MLKAHIKVRVEKKIELLLLTFAAYALGHRVKYDPVYKVILNMTTTF